MAAMIEHFTLSILDVLQVCYGQTQKLTARYGCSFGANTAVPCISATNQFKGHTWADLDRLWDRASKPRSKRHVSVVT